MSQFSLPVQTFMQEAAETLEALEARLLELETDPANAELVDAVFRCLHTLKGSGEMFGFTALARFTHVFESAYDAVRASRARVSPELIEISFRAQDHIQRLIEIGTDEAENARMEAAPEGAALLAEIEALTGAAGPQAPDTPAPPAADTRARVVHLRFAPEPSAFRNGLRPDLLVVELETLGTCEIQASAEAVPPLEELDAAACHLAWEGTLETAASRAQIEDVFLFADDGALTLTDPGDGAAASGLDCADAPEPPASPAPDPQPPAAAERRGGESDARPPGAATAGDSVRVRSQRLDELMDQIGELVIAQARLAGLAERLADPALSATAEEIERLITGLRDSTLSIRMLPIGSVFGKFRRVVRDLSAELGKSVTLVTEGEDTELDKNVIDKLSEPLVHIIRNSVDHGIETAEARAEAGKPPEARVTMAARQAGGDVLVTISDDGGGLRTRKIRERAVDRGLIAADDDLSDKQINQLIFAPGFSTAQGVSSVSGRGVGMDAVKSVISDLGGAVEIDSAPGRGTEITLRLPLTLAIIEGLLVRVSDQPFVIPLAAVDECVERSRHETRTDGGRAILTIRDELVPFIDLETLFALDATDGGTARRIVVARTDRRRVGLVVSEIVGQHQTVIKPLSPYHRDIDGLAGGTILGDGTVALILDPGALVRGLGAGITEAA